MNFKDYSDSALLGFLIVLFLLIAMVFYSNPTPQVTFKLFQPSAPNGIDFNKQIEKFNTSFTHSDMKQVLYGHRPKNNTNYIL